MGKSNITKKLANTVKSAREAARKLTNPHLSEGGRKHCISKVTEGKVAEEKLGKKDKRITFNQEISKRHFQERFRSA